MRKLGQSTLPLFDDSWTRKWNVNRLVLMVRDPHRLFAYWEVDDFKRKLVSEHFQTEWDNLPFYLRIHDVTDLMFDGYNSHSVSLIRVRPQSDNWYLNQVSSGRSYVADFGTTTWQGEFFALVRSNVVQTPPVPTFDMATQVHLAPAYGLRAVAGAVQAPQTEARLHNAMSRLAEQAGPSQTPIQAPRWAFEQDFDGYRLGSPTQRGD